MILLDKYYALEKADNQYQLGIIDEQTKIGIIKFLNSLPSAQPEIIYCRECKYQIKYFHEDKRRKDGGYYVYGCELADDYSHVCFDEDFCSKAEKRER